MTITPPDASAVGIITKFPAPQTTLDTPVSWKLKIKVGAQIGRHQITFTGRDASGRVRTGTITMIVE